MNHTHTTFLLVLIDESLSRYNLANTKNQIITWSLPWWLSGVMHYLLFWMLTQDYSRWLCSTHVTLRVDWAMSHHNIHWVAMTFIDSFWVPKTHDFFLSLWFLLTFINFYDIWLHVTQVDIYYESFALVFLCYSLSHICIATILYYLLARYWYK